MSVVSICIGKVVEITNTYISIMLTDSTQRPYKIIDGIPIRIGGVGDFVRVDSDVYEITNVKTTLDKVAGKHTQAATQKILLCTLIGYFKEGKFCQGNSGNTPNVFENVYTITDDELVAVYAGTSVDTSITAGKYLYADDLDFRIDINKFFASHILIVGNTGSGKSNSLNTIYSKLFDSVNTKDSKFLVIDTNGEYSKAFSNKKHVKHLNSYDAEKNDIQIPLNLLVDEDWKLLLEATEKTQYPIVKKVWNGIKRNIFEKKDADIGKYICEKLIDCIVEILNSSSFASNRLSNILSLKDDITYMKGPFYENLLKIFEHFEQVAVNNNRLVRADGNVYEDITVSLAVNVKAFRMAEKLEEFSVYDFGFLLGLEHIYRTFKYNSNENNTSPMIARFNSNRSQFAKIFTAYSSEYQGASILESIFEDSNIVVCDVANASKDIRRIIVTFMCGKLYREFVTIGRCSSSLHLIVDEAHNYLSHQKMEGEDPIAKTCIETFESIIKE